VIRRRGTIAATLALALAMLSACARSASERTTVHATPIAAVSGAPAWSAGDVRALQANLQQADSFQTVREQLEETLLARVG